MEIVLSSGQIMAGPSFTAVGTTHLLDEEEGNVLMTLVAEGLLSNEAQIPAEAALVGHLETPKAVDTRVLNNIATGSTHADPDELLTEA